jgi:hypothetical protein
LDERKISKCVAELVRVHGWTPGDIRLKRYNNLKCSLDDTAVLEKVQWGLNDVEREIERNGILDSQPLVHDLYVATYTPGPCSRCNCWSKREIRSQAKASIDMCLCRPLTRYELGAPEMKIYPDKLVVERPTWKSGYGDFQFAAMFESPQKVPFHKVVDTIDFFTLVDVDYTLYSIIDSHPETLVWTLVCAVVGQSAAATRTTASTFGFPNCGSCVDTRITTSPRWKAKSSFGIETAWLQNSS